MATTVYLKKTFGIGAIIVGAYFLIEHIFVWDEVAFFDFIGHEWLGFVLILFGIGLNTNWSLSRLSEELTKAREKSATSS